VFLFFLGRCRFLWCSYVVVEVLRARMHPPGSRNIRKLLLFINRVSTLVYFEDAKVIAHLCYPVPFPIELVLGSP
jgi:hypothetical protein